MGKHVLNRLPITCIGNPSQRQAEIHLQRAFEAFQKGSESTYDKFPVPRPVMSNVKKQLNQQEQQRWQEEIKQAMGQFEGPEGLIIPAELLLGVGTR